MKKSNKMKATTIDDLARMVANGFTDVEKRFVGIDGKFDSLEEKMNQKFDQRFNQLSNRIDDLALNRVTWEGLKVVQARIDRIERKLHISLK